MVVRRVVQAWLAQYATRLQFYKPQCFRRTNVYWQGYVAIMVRKLARWRGCFIAYHDGPRIWSDACSLPPSDCTRENAVRRPSSAATDTQTSSNVAMAMANSDFGAEQ
jgi:hypothetical protein